MFKIILSLLCALVLGYSIPHLPTPYFPLKPEVWIFVATIALIGIIFCLYSSSPPQQKIEESCSSMDELKEEFHRFQKQSKLILRGHLKVSILFWIYSYKREKMKTFEEAKKKIFQDLKREFQNIQWVLPLLEEIYRELARYK